MKWKKTTCVICGNLCGLEVQVSANQIVKVRGDKENLRSRGYVCRKGLNIRYYQHHGDRLMHPMKKVNGRFEKISWDQATEEIAQKLKAIVGDHGPRSLALMGGATISGQSQAFFAVGLLYAMGSQYFYNALAQELTGRYWVEGEVFGNQSRHTTADHHNTDMMLIVGKNPMMSNHLDQARRFLPKFAKDPDKTLVVVDPRRSRTAKLADIHLAIRPGTDALLYRSMIAIILQKGWQNQAYIDKNVTGFEKIRPLFETFDVRAALEVCELDYDQVKEVSRLFATRQSSHESDLGVLMTRHSTLISWLENILRAICGRIGVKGGNLFGLNLASGGPVKIRNREKEARAWRTVMTDFPPITGAFPPNAMPEEILNDHPDRLRAVIVTASNPLRSFADTTAYEKAFSKLDLLVTVEIAMTETAAMSDYVLPALSDYESWDGGFPTGFPEIFMQYRHPVVKAEGLQLEASEIFTRLADKLGLIPEIPEYLYEASESGDLSRYSKALTKFITDNPEAGGSVQYIIAKTLGWSLESVNKSALWSKMNTLPPWADEKAARKGFTPGPNMGNEIFKAIVDNPGGLHVGSVDPDTWEHLKVISTEDGKINLDVAEMIQWIEEIDPALEAQALKEDEKEYPLLISSGHHNDFNSNAKMRDPEWNRGKRCCTLRMHPEDMEKMGFTDGQTARIVTEGGQETIELQKDGTTRPGYTMMPQGFGMVHQGKTYGANANRIASAAHRDRLAGTPYHRYIRCRVEAV